MAGADESAGSTVAWAVTVGRDNRDEFAAIECTGTADTAESV